MNFMNEIKKQYQIAPVTTILLFFTILIYLVEVVLSGANTENGRFLVTMGAKWGPYIQYQHEYWRLLTPIFLHAGMMHIIMNMITLWFIGPLAERYFGSRKYLLLYLFGGVMGNILSYLFSPLSISVGASSSLFALFGGLLIYSIQFKYDTQIRSQGMLLGVFVVLNLASGLMSPDIDMLGHVGGLVGGLLFAIAFGFAGRSGKFPILWRLTAILVMVLTVGLVLLRGNL